MLRNHLKIIGNDENALSGIWKNYMKIDGDEAAIFLDGEHIHDCIWAADRGLIKEVRHFGIPHDALGRIEKHQLSHDFS